MLALSSHDIVELVFKNYGIDSFEVRDNGKGIDPSDWSGIGDSISSILLQLLTIIHSSQASHLEINSIFGSYCGRNFRIPW